ncbi:HlyD family type I secretion periplasmic adaptor subunit [Loktanella sp. DJP18]|uniref:HlyD family type I secretion periplasmic adaptor subunit n=1 Tax=Loktanella sp. DJP18 TaxID=3409788 RepID=UPI003BB81633
MTTLSPTAPPPTNLRVSLRPALWLGLSGLVALVGVCGLWAATTVIGGAVIAQGQVTVHGKPQQVQHLDGGMIAAIDVSNGDHVTAGQVLLRLDPTVVQLNRDMAERRLIEALTLAARLTAEQQGRNTLAFSYPMLPFALPDMAEAEAGQRQIFAARRAVQQGGRDQLTETLLQIDAQITGQQAQAGAIRDQMGYLDTDIANKRTLADRALIRQSDLNDLQRAQADMRGRLAGIEADIARLTNARAESTLQTLQAERSFKESVVLDLREATAQVEELTLEIITRQAQLNRIDLRAPVAGIVHEMAVSTVGGVVAPGEVLMQIIPQDPAREFEMRIDPRAVDQVWPGQTAQVVMAAFDPSNTPKLIGEVVRISPNVVVDPQTGQRFYRVDLSVPEIEIARLGAVEIVPGMPVEAFLETGDRSVLAYLVQPFATQLRRAFRES